LGEDAESLLGKALAADNAVLEGLPAGVTTGLHLCRGNFRSRWWAQGSLEPVAERMFGELRYDRLLVEWEDTEREGDYSALRFVPADGPIVVMGVVSSKLPALESDEEILRRMDEAARYLDIGRLAISPQCGFASVWYGNELTEDDQWRKLELVTRTANKIWGS
jgi:5-methyltetrahydropteroyltriglutamate--homocysteine methyltransferase